MNAENTENCTKITDIINLITRAKEQLNKRKNRAITADDFERTEKGYRDLWILVKRNFDSVTHWCAADHEKEVVRLRLLVRHLKQEYDPYADLSCGIAKSKPRAKRPGPKSPHTTVTCDPTPPCATTNTTTSSTTTSYTPPTSATTSTTATTTTTTATASATVKRSKSSCDIVFCANCLKSEEPEDQFLTCAKCLKDHSLFFHETKLYCSPACCRENWDELHKNEHKRRKLNNHPALTSFSVD